MPNLKGSRTERNLRESFAHEAQANRLYLYFAAKAEAEGRADVASLFRSTADGETGHALGHLQFLEAAGEPLTGMPFGPTDDNLRVAMASEVRESGEMYPAMARVARDEGFAEIADWFETLANSERSHASRYQRALDALDAPKPGGGGGE